MMGAATAIVVAVAMIAAVTLLPALLGSGRHQDRQAVDPSQVARREAGGRDAVRPLGASRRPAPDPLRGPQPRRPVRDRAARVPHAHRHRRRQQRGNQHDTTQGLRPARRRLRQGLQRPDRRRRRRPRPRATRSRPRRLHDALASRSRHRGGDTAAVQPDRRHRHPAGRSRRRRPRTRPPTRSSVICEPTCSPRRCKEPAPTRHSPDERWSPTSPNGSPTGCRCSSRAVIALSFLLLMIVFRSILVPLKAALMNMLSIGAAYGVVVAIFQWGWGKDVIGLEHTDPDQPVRPDDHVRHPLRALDGLRGVPPVTSARGVRAHRRQPHLGRRRPVEHRTGDHLAPR